MLSHRASTFGEILAEKFKIVLIVHLYACGHLKLFGVGFHPNLKARGYLLLIFQLYSKILIHSFITASCLLPL